MDSTTLDALNEERTELVRRTTHELLAQLPGRLRSELAADFVTRAEFEERMLKSITDTLNTRLDKIEEDQEGRFEAFVKRYEQRFETVATKDELTGVQKSGAENTASISRLEAKFDAQLAAHDKRLNKVEDIQTQQAANIEQMTGNIATMTQNTESIRQSVQTMNNTVLEEIERDRKRQTEIDRQHEQLKEADKDADRRLHTLSAVQDADRERLQGVQDEVNTLYADITDQRGRIVEALAPMQLVINGDRDKDIPGMHERMAQLERGLSVAIFFLANPIGRILLAALVFLMIERPDIIGAILPVLNQK